MWVRKMLKDSIFQSGLRRKTLLVTGFLMLAAITSQFLLSYKFLSDAFDEDIYYVKLGFDTNIKTAVETVVGVLHANHQMYLKGLISEETAKATAHRIVRDTRYSSGAGKVNDGYFWADMADGLCAVHYNPVNEGAMRLNWQDHQEGMYFIREFIRQGDAGGGYSDFYFGKPGDEQGSHKKRGYTLKFEPYWWYISTGNYYADTNVIIDRINETKRTDLNILFCVSLFTVIIGLFLMSLNLNSVISPIINISHRVQRLSRGDTSSDPFPFTAKYEIGNLQKGIIDVIVILNSLLENINVMISEHKKGNIDYKFDTDEFLGNYKTLAHSVLDLASTGMLDQLTGIPNRRSFDSRLDMEWQRAAREKMPLSILMLDIDKFKVYNDTFGHQQGDLTLQAIANIINESIRRPTDLAARWGGEEFAVLLPNTDANGAFVIAEKIRTSIEKMVIPCDDERGRKATVSIGVNTQIFAPGSSSIENFISVADNALYKAKEAGRNRVCQL